MKTALILVVLCCAVIVHIVKADDKSIGQHPAHDASYRGEPIPGSARDLPRSERRRLRLLELEKEHNMRKRDTTSDSDASQTTKKKTVSQGRGSIKAIDTFKQDAKKNDEYFAGSSKNFQFAYNLNDHNRQEALQFARHPKELRTKIDDGTYSENDEDNNVVAAKGSFSFISADGFKYTTQYVADNKGFRPIVLVEKI